MRRVFYPYDVAENLKIKLPGEKDDKTAFCGIMGKKKGLFTIRRAYRVAMCLATCTMVW